MRDTANKQTAMEGGAACVSKSAWSEGLGGKGAWWGCGLDRCRHPFSIWCELHSNWPKSVLHKPPHTHSALMPHCVPCSSVISRAPGLKLVVETLMSSLKPIGNIVVICCAFFIIFGILGVQVRGEGEMESIRTDLMRRLCKPAWAIWHVIECSRRSPPSPEPPWVYVHLEGLSEKQLFFYALSDL